MVRFSLEEIKNLIGADLVGDPTVSIDGVASLENAKGTDLSFLSNSRYRQHLKSTEAKAVIVSKEEELEPLKNYLVVKNPTVAFQIVVEAFYQKKESSSSFKGIHPTAVIDPSVQLGKDVVVGPNSVIEAGVVIGDRSNIGSLVYVGPKVIIGSDCRIYSNVSIREECILGDRVILQPGCVIGSCGFGYMTDKTGAHKKLNQVGIVELADDVEVGALTSIDRARFDKTYIGQGTKIDNLVMIGHNVQVGKHCLIISQVGIAGSTELGNHVVLAGKVGVSGHVKIGDGAMVGAFSGVSKSLEAGGKYIGIPAEPAATYFRTMGLLRQLSKMQKKLLKALKQFGLTERDDQTSE